MFKSCQISQKITLIINEKLVGFEPGSSHFKV